MTMVAIPAFFTFIQATSHNFFIIFEKWFVFSSLGLRLLLAGIKQLTDPSFTLEKIFNIRHSASIPLVKEIGLHNFCLGFAGVLTLCISSLSLGVLFIGGLYLGMAGILHVIKKPQTYNERVATISDIVAFIVAFGLLFNNH
jgi:hypothetical protein